MFLFIHITEFTNKILDGIIDEKYSNSIFTQEKIMVVSSAADRAAAVRPAAGCPAAIKLVAY